MPDKTPDLRLSEPDLALIGKLTIAENLFLTTAAAVAGLNVIGWLAPSLRGLFAAGWSPMSAEAAVATLLSAASLRLSRPRYRGWIQALSMGIAVLVAACSALVLGGQIVSSAPGALSKTASWVGEGMMPLAAGCFLLLGLTTVVIRARRRMGVMADLATLFLLFITAVLVSGDLFGVMGIFGPVSTYATPGQTALCLLLLAAVVLLRRAENGVFSILLGRGIGSKIARMLVPLLVFLPYVREGLRAHFINFRSMPPHYVTALLATVAMVFSISLVTYLAWRLNALETEIQGLSLRDALTGVYNLRGFQLLAEQALLLARRSGQPFSVLFIDVDNLKQINDTHGHRAGSELLATMADILREVFRETDVLGRMGGDEFAVAGQFNRDGMAEAAQRLRQATMLRNADASRATLKFSAGWVTSSPEKRTHLADLLAKADEEMYREKRRRKGGATGSSKTSAETELLQRGAQESADLHEVGNA